MKYRAREAWERTDENLVAPALHPRIHAYLRRRMPPEMAQEAEDLAQQTVMVALDARRKKAMRRESLLRYAYGVARNLLCSALRRRGREPSVPLDDAPVDHLRDRSITAGVLEKAERRAKVAQAMGRLSALERAILHLRCVEGRRNRDVAATLGIDPECCSKLKYEALRKLRNELTAPG